MSTDGSQSSLIGTSDPGRGNRADTGRGGSTSQALKVAGVTLLAGLLIAGQAFTAYTLYSHKEQLSTLERRSDRLQELSRKFVMRAPLKMNRPMSALALKLEDEPQDKDIPSTSSKPEPRVLTQCQKEASGEAKSPLPSFRPRCDGLGDYEPEQCWEQTNWCWCVDKNGVQIPDSLTNGSVECWTFNSADTKVMPLVGADGQ